MGEATSFSEFRSKFFALIAQASAIVITSHMSPDDDSIGSVLAVYTVLKKEYPEKNIRIVYSGEKVARYGVFHNFEKIEWVPDIVDHLEGVDTLVTVDASNWRRFTKAPEKLETIPTRIGFDHHASEPDQYTLLLHQKEYSSNTHLIYDALIDGEDITKEMAEYLLLGLVGDTGNFSYVKPQQSDAFIFGKKLVETVGISIDQFRSRYGGIPLRIIPLLQELVKNTKYVSVPGWPDAQYTFVPRATLVEGAFTDEDISAASHIYMGQYLPRVEGYGWGFVITPRNDGGCRMSGRSLPTSVNVRDLHERLGIGSGHDRASGGYFTEAEPSDCIAKVIDWMHNNAPLVG